MPDGFLYMLGREIHILSTYSLFKKNSLTNLESLRNDLKLECLPHSDTDASIQHSIVNSC